MIDAEEMEKRRKAVRAGFASVELEGFVISPETRAYAERFISGEIDFEEYGAATYEDVHGRGG